MTKPRFESACEAIRLAQEEIPKELRDAFGILRVEEPRITVRLNDDGEGEDVVSFHISQTADSMVVFSLVEIESLGPKRLIQLVTDRYAMGLMELAGLYRITAERIEAAVAKRKR